MVVIFETTSIYDNRTEQEEINKHRLNFKEEKETQDTQYTYFKYKRVMKKTGTEWIESEV